MSGQGSIHVTGNVSGQVASGSFVYQVQAPGGTVTQVVVDEPVRPRPRPVDLRPGLGVAPLGRDTVLATLAAEPARPVQVHAEAGWGKTTVLRHFAHAEAAAAAPDGVVHVSAWGRRADDVEQDLFDAFYESALPQMALRATPAQVRASLRDVRATVLVDDLDVDRAHLERILDAVPRSRVVVTSVRHTLLDGVDVPLRGLDAGTALRVFTDRLARPLDEAEAAAVAVYATACDGQPLALVLAAAAVARGALDVAALRGGPAVVADAIGESLDAAERRALEVLAAVDGAPLPGDAVGAAAGIEDADAVLGRLRDAGLVLSASPRFRLPAGLADGLRLADVRADVLRSLSTWGGRATSPEAITAAGPALLALARWGRRQAPADTVALARATHAGFAVAGEWGGWSQLLQLARDAATEAFDRAWAMHELGTWNLLTGQRTAAVAQLREALELRTRIRDLEGARATRHNLGLLEAPPPREPDDGRGAPRDPGGGADGPTGGGLAWTWIVGLVAAAGVLWLFLANGVFGGGGPSGPTEGATTETAAPGTLESGITELQLGEVVVGEQAATTVSLFNPGPSPVTVGQVAVDEPFRATVDCTTVAALESCRLEVAYAPTEVGDHAGTVAVHHDGAGSPLALPARGTAILPPRSHLAAEPATLDLGTVRPGEPTRGVVAIHNDGEVPVEEVRPALAGGDRFAVEGGCPGLGPGDTCELLVTFAAPEPGPHDDVLVVDHSGDFAALEVPLTATVVAPPDLVARVVESGIAVGTEDDGDFAWYPLPVTVGIDNLGGEPVADAFRLHAEVDDGDGFAWIPIGTSRTDLGDVFVDGGLAPGDTREVTFWVAFSIDRYEAGQVVGLRVVVDSCFAEEFVEDPPCRVAELDEGNNVSAPLPVLVDLEDPADG